MLFVGTKKQCQEAIREEAERIGMPFVSTRWLGGLLTNYATLSKRIRACTSCASWSPTARSTCCPRASR